MVVCRFYEQGNCRYGSNCKFEHPNNNRQNQNPFSVLQNQRGPAGRPAGGNNDNPYHLLPDTIVKDLTEERPSWSLSAYGPGREAPEQLWGGPIEQSYEEMRLHFELAAAQGNPQAALNDIQQLEAQAQQKIQAAIGNPKAAIDYIMQAANNHPNRIDLTRNDPSRSTGEFAVGKRPVGNGSAHPPNPFGQPSGLGQTSTPFAGGTPGFGQPSTLGQPSPFGQPSALGGGALGGGALGGGAFGQTSTLGQKPNPFGQPSGSTGFGQTSTLGQKPNPFGTPGFGQVSTLGSKPNPFSSGNSGAAAPTASPFSAFTGNNTNNAATPSPFSAISGANTNAGQAAPNGQPTGFGQPQQPPTTEVSMDGNATPVRSAFGAPNNAAAPANPFAPATQPAAPAFGQPTKPAGSVFGQPTQPAANPFGQASSAASPFGAPAPQPAASVPSAASAAGSTSSGPYAPNASRQHPPLSSYANKAPDGTLLTWKGQPVAYKEVEEVKTPGVQTGGFGQTSWSKIWFPDGPPSYYQDTEPDQEYSDADKATWQRFVSTGKFDLAATGGAGMPTAPPKREFVQWDF